MQVTRAVLVKYARPAAGAALALSPALAMAQGVDYSDLTDAISWTAVISALLVAGAAVVGVLVVRRGIGFIVDMVRRG